MSTASLPGLLILKCSYPYLVYPHCSVRFFSRTGCWKAMMIAHHRKDFRPPHRWHPEFPCANFQHLSLAHRPDGSEATVRKQGATAADLDGTSSGADRSRLFFSLADCIPVRVLPLIIDPKQLLHVNGMLRSLPMASGTLPQLVIESGKIRSSP